MFQIAICDDQPRELENIVNYTKEYIETNRVDAKLSQFSHPDILLTACETERFSLYILDIVMPMVNGIEVGREIRRFDRESQIIYTTSEPSFALDAYSANPVNYLIKPINKKQLFDTLSLAISRIDLTEDETIKIKTNAGLRVVPLFAIIFCEFVDRAVKYTLASGETITTRTLQESFAEHVSKLLQNKQFLQPHSAFVLNMSRVDCFSKEGFTMRGGVVVPISSKQYSAVREKFLDFLLAKEFTK